MNHRLIFLLLFFKLSTNVIGQFKLQVKDVDTSENIPYATISIKNKFMMTDDKGLCSFKLNVNKYYIEISHLSYEPYKRFYNFKEGVNVLYLKNKSTVLKEAIVYGHKHKRLISKTSIGQSLDKTVLQKNTDVELGTILEKIEGVSTIKTGGTIVKPVIQGMYGNRIVIINNGVVQQGQDWSVEHGTEIDPFIAEKISVIKGAEGVKYGSGAIGGVVLISPKKLPYYKNKTQGKILGILTSNGHSTTTSTKLEGSLLDNHFAWRFQGTKQISADLKTAEYFLNNTGTNSLSYSLNFGYKNRTTGVEFFYSDYQKKYGLTYISEVGNKNDLKDRFEIGKPLQVYPGSYTIEPPKQQVKHQLFKVNGFWKPFEKLNSTFQYSLQKNKRKEFFPRRGGLSEVPAFNTNLLTHATKVSMEYKWNNMTSTDFGLKYNYQINENITGTKIDPTIPNFLNSGVESYLIQKYSTKNLNLTSGARYTSRKENIAGVRNSKHFSNTRSYSNFMYSLSGLYNHKKLAFISNIGLSTRFPHVSELYSKGLKHGGLTFLNGNEKLSSEQGLKWVNGIRYENDLFYINLSGYLQRFENYIYEQPTIEEINLWSGVFTKSYFKQANAFFKGIDANLCIHLTKDLSYLVKGSLVHALNLDTKGYFPFIPSERINQDLKFDKPLKKSMFENIYFGVSHNYVAKQHRIDNASDLLQKTPKAYHLLNISAGVTSKKINKKQISLHLTIDNLSNNLYKEYTNRYRYFAHDLGRNIKIKTIFNF